YAGTDYTFVEEGYPLTICTALQEEPRFKNLKAPWQGVVDAAFADERNVYLVQGNNLQIISDSASRSYDFQETKATTKNDGHLWHTLRHADGSWQGLGDVQSQFTIPAPVRVVAAAGDGPAGATQYIFATADGHLWHTMRRADGSCKGLGDVQSQFTFPTRRTAVPAAGGSYAGETPYASATADGHLWHTLRRADGSWTGLGDVQSQFAIPAPVRVVAAAGDGTAGETQYFFATADGQLGHSGRVPDGGWARPGGGHSVVALGG